MPAYRGLPARLVIGTVLLTLMRHPPATLTLAAGLLVLPAAVAARSPGDPVRLVWVEGDVAGTSTIYGPDGDRKSTRLNSSHLVISYAVFCLKKKSSSTRQPAIMSCNACF